LTNDTLFPYQHAVSRSMRSNIKGHLPLVIWLTGLSGSGKSSIANELEIRLVREYKAHTYLLDGDNIRAGLNTGLGFSEADRKENIRRIGEVAKLLYDAGLIVITAFISPYRSDRDMVRDLFRPGTFWEVFVSCPLEICKNRDPKGLYSKALRGEIPDFTGISSPYESPILPELILRSDQLKIEESVTLILSLMVEKMILKLSGKRG
jgi:adenylylsulfate kinase